MAQASFVAVVALLIGGQAADEECPAFGPKWGHVRVCTSACQVALETPRDFEPGALEPAFLNGAGVRVDARVLRALSGRAQGRSGVLVEADGTLEPGDWSFSWGPGYEPLSVNVIASVESVPTLAVTSMTEVLAAQKIACGDEERDGLGGTDKAYATDPAARPFDVTITFTANGRIDHPHGMTLDVWVLPADDGSAATQPADPPTLERVWNVHDGPARFITYGRDDAPIVHGGEKFRVAVRGVMPDGRFTNVVEQEITAETHAQGNSCGFSNLLTMLGAFLFVAPGVRRIAGKSPERLP